eukprot:TRINITY_DN29239_c0_g1_i1.p1 TRINITY_DN29239_c0_g1~~TRINITY_DN29239_c0_g1_i1.p1  ORF type:complete len:252 (+),score=57.67 TRINITY_DN29239_c0_g1_i1:77-832(+)
MCIRDRAGRSCADCGRASCPLVCRVPSLYNESVLTVAIYHPIQNKLQQQILVLGSQTLADLKDKIYCLKDEVYSNLLPPDLNATSSFFFIENVFYNDMRLAHSQKTSSVIIEWAAKTSWPVTKLTTDDPVELVEKNMQDAFLKDIPIAVGEQYMFCHQGNCEHLVVFEQMEAVHWERIANIEEYPLQVLANHKLRKCSICNVHVAVKETRHDDLAPEDPCFFCEVCYRQLHYSEDGELLYQGFEVYEYHHE